MGKIFGISDLPVVTLEQALGIHPYPIMPQPKFYDIPKNLPKSMGDTDKFISQTHNNKAKNTVKNGGLAKLYNRLMKK